MSTTPVGGTQSEDIRITGMTCVGCTRNVESALAKVDGVLSAAVNLATERAHVEYDASRTDRGALTRAVEGAGYGVADDSATLCLQVTGMSCQGCVQTVAAALRSVQGVRDAAVNLAAGTATVRYDPGRAGVNTLVAAVELAGYSASPLSSTASDGEDVSAREMAAARRRMVLAWALTGPLVVLMLPFMLGVDAVAPYMVRYEWGATLLALVVLAVAGRRTFSSAWRSLRHGAANMDVLIMLGSGAALLTGPLSLAGLGIHSYAGVGAMIMAFHLTGRYVEAKARGRASKAIRELLELGAKTARVVRDGEEHEVPVGEIRVGDVMVVRPGEKVPTDGVVVDGRSTVDESMVSGESVPVTRAPGDEVVGATINREGVLKVEATRVGSETFLAQVVRMVREAQGSRVPVQAFADRVTACFVPVIVGLSLFTFLAWLLFDEQMRSVAVLASRFLPWVNADLSAVSLAVFAGVAVMVIACPCALGLATPTALMVGTGLGARSGILIRSGEAIQTMKDVQVICFDKTGTLTRGAPEVTDVVPFGNLRPEEVVRWAASLEQVSEHPLGQAIVVYAREHRAGLAEAEDFTAVPGRGVHGCADGHEIVVGSRSLLEEQGVGCGATREAAARLEAAARTCVFVGVDGAVAGLIGLADTLKDGAPAAVAVLKKMGFRVAMITGDNERTARAIAADAGIDRVVAGVLPDRKAEEVRRLQDEIGPVAMVGDGINDAPALARADVGIALGTGTDIAIESADITLISGDLGAVISAVKLSRATFRKIRQNLLWAFGYNLVAIPAAMLGLLHPVMAEVAMAFSSISVVSNSTLLRRADIGPSGKR